MLYMSALHGFVCGSRRCFTFGIVSPSTPTLRENATFGGQQQPCVGVCGCVGWVWVCVRACAPLNHMHPLMNDADGLGTRGCGRLGRKPDRHAAHQKLLTCVF